MSVTSAEALHCFVPTTQELDPTNEGRLSAVTVAVKDLFSIKGHTSSFGHTRWRETHGPASAHAQVVNALLAAGATVTGVTKMDQLAYSLVGNVGEGEPPVNSHDPERFAGGSSSGSASAVAGGIADLGLGTDTAGSIRVPAAACGLFSLRPTHDSISKDGVLPLAPSLDVVGLLARSPELLEQAYRAVASPSAITGRTETVLRRVLLPVDLTMEDANIRRALATVAARELGAEVEEVAVAHLVDGDVGTLFMRIQSREIWSQHSEWIRENIDALASDVQTRLLRCEKLAQDDPAVIQADLDAREHYRSAVEALLGDDGTLVLPVLPRRGPLRSWSQEELLAYRGECFQLTAPSSLAGVPQAVVRASHGGEVYSGSFLAPSGADLQLLGLIGDIAYEDAGVRL